MGYNLQLTHLPLRAPLPSLRFPQRAHWPEHKADQKLHRRKGCAPALPAAAHPPPCKHSTACGTTPSTPPPRPPCRLSLCRVCQRWHDLINGPSLLAHVSVQQLEAREPRDADMEQHSASEESWDYSQDWVKTDRPVQHILDFFDWLERRAAPHVQSLDVGLGELALPGTEGEWSEESVTDELRCALRACTNLRVGRCTVSLAPACRLLLLLPHQLLPLPHLLLLLLDPFPFPSPLLCTAAQHLTLHLQCPLRLCASKDLASAAQGCLRTLAITSEDVGRRPPFESPACLRLRRWSPCAWQAARCCSARCQASAASCSCCRSRPTVCHPA